MDHGTRYVRFMKKTGGKKSRETIPLSQLFQTSTNFIKKVPHLDLELILKMTLSAISALVPLHPNVCVLDEPSVIFLQTLFPLFATWQPCIDG